jgi:parallel beta-helix repeat protein
MRLLRKTVSAIMLSLLVISTLTSTFNIQSVKAEGGTVYIRADGSVDPSTAPIQRDGDTYAFTDNIYDEIVVERSNIIVDGAGHTVQGTGAFESVGISLSNVQNITIRDINIKNFYYGIYFIFTSHSTITQNNITNNSRGILHVLSSNNIISGNNITNNEIGIYLFKSSNNNISGNNFIRNGLFVYDSYSNIVVGNCVNNKPLVYLEGISGVVVGDAGQVILVDCDNITVENLNLSKTDIGVQLLRTSNTKIRWNNITANNLDGICLHHSSYNTIYRNKLTANKWYGIELAFSSNNTISGNNITASGSDGILLDWSSNNNNISQNNIANNGVGIHLDISSNNNNIFGNNMTSNHSDGIILSLSNNTNISQNNIANNGRVGYFWKSSNNVIFHNNFVDNIQQVYSYNSVNVWDDGYPSGGNYWSDYTDVDLCSGPNQDQPGSDGIWDHPYVIDANNTDQYPLVNPWTPIPARVHGIDVSHHQGNINWSEVYGAGYRFAFVKASEGVGWMDSNFVTNMDNGSDADLLMGAYHFARPDLGNNAVDEALYFVSVARNYLKGGYLRPALDLEVGSSLGKEALSNWVHEWMETVKNETGIEPIIYVDSNYANNYLDASVAKYDLWIAHWTYDPTASPNTGIWDTWDFWQYSNNGSVPGISGNVDLDLFYGDTYKLHNAFVIPENQLPVALFNYSPIEPKAGEQVTFDASSSYDLDGRIVSYEWDWDGDGDYEDYTEFPTITSWWMEEGTYNLGLKVVDDKGALSVIYKDITIRKSADSKANAILVGWFDWTHASWWKNHWDFKRIDSWLRQFEPGSKPLEWLKGTKFAWCEEADLIYILDKEIDPSQAPGFTYKVYALNAIHEEQLVHEAWTQTTPTYNYVIKPLLKYAFGTVWSLFISEQAIINLSPYLGIGVSTARMACKVLSLKNLFEDIDKVAYSIALGTYFRYRWLYSIEEAWNLADPSARISIPASASEEEKMVILEDTKWYFEELWQKYRGEEYYEPYRGLPIELRQQYREELKSLLLSALEKYANELPNRKRAQIASPVELRVYDSYGRITGIINGEEREQIPNSVYDSETKTATIFLPGDSLSYEVVGTGAGTYGLGITSIENGQIINFSATDIPTSTTAIHQFTINWTALSQGEEGVTVKVDSNGDGVFEHTFTSDSELTQSEFLAQTAPPPLSASISPLSASILVGQSVTFTSTVSGGYTPYTYQWYLNGAPVSGATTNTWTFTPTASGMYNVYLKVTDAMSNTAQSETARITVAAVTVETATGTGVATFSTDLGTIENLVAVSEAALPEAGKPNLTFPHGFFSFRIVGLTPGASVTVTITLPSSMPVGTQYWKYQTGKGWYQIPIGDDDGDNVITIRLTDGGLGDGDGQANGVIVDPGGPGSPPPVGGLWVPINKLELLAPWIVLASLITMVTISVVYVKHRKKQQN